MAYTTDDIDSVARAIMALATGDRVVRVRIGDEVTEYGQTDLLAEQNVKFTLKLSDYGYIIDNGRICAQGTVKELMEDEDVRKTCGI